MAGVVASWRGLDDDEGVVSRDGEGCQPREEEGMEAEVVGANGIVGDRAGGGGG